jgi:hypothetical protein
MVNFYDENHKCLLIINDTNDFVFVYEQITSVIVGIAYLSICMFNKQVERLQVNSNIVMHLNEHDFYRINITNVYANNRNDNEHGVTLPMDTYMKSTE